MVYDQCEYRVRFEWGPQGVACLAPVSDAIVIVDVLSFTTAVCIAAARGATVFPYRWADDTAADYARSKNALLAGPRREGGYSLSPGSLTGLPRGSRIVLPSPNGATLSLATGETPTFAGCLRNAGAVARAARSCGSRIAVIACGERWPDGALRPALEDHIGAGAVLSRLCGARSPEAAAAIGVFESVRTHLAEALRNSVSGKELVGRGFGDDVALASALNSDDVAPRLRNRAYSVSCSTTACR